MGAGSDAPQVTTCPTAPSGHYLLPYAPQAYRSTQRKITVPEGKGRKPPYSKAGSKNIVKVQWEQQSSFLQRRNSFDRSALRTDFLQRRAKSFAMAFLKGMRAFSLLCGLGTARFLRNSASGGLCNCLQNLGCLYSQNHRKSGGVSRPNKGLSPARSSRSNSLFYIPTVHKRA